MRLSALMTRQNLGTSRDLGLVPRTVDLAPYLGALFIGETDAMVILDLAQGIGLISAKVAGGDDRIHCLGNVLGVAHVFYYNHSIGNVKIYFPDFHFHRHLCDTPRTDTQTIKKGWHSPPP